MNLKKFSVLFKFCILLLLCSFCSGGEAIVKEIGTFPTIEGNNLNKVSKKVPDDFVERDLSITENLNDRFKSGSTQKSFGL